MPAHYQKLIIALALGGIFIFGIWPAFHSAAMPMDEGMVLVYPEMILKGNLPYRDFESITGPTNPLILAGAYALFGTNIFVERTVGLAYRLFIVWAVFGIAQRWSVLAATICSLLTLILLTETDLWANTWYTGLSFALAALWVLANVESRWRCFAGGLFAAIALLGRCDFGPVLIAACLPSFLLMERDTKLKFIAGGVLGLTPLLWLIIVMGPAPIVRSLFLFPVFELNPARHLPISAAPRQMQSFLALQIVGGLINIAAGILELRKAATRRRGALLFGAGILGLGIIHYAVQRFDFGHALNSIIIAASFFPLSIFILVSAAKIISKRIAAASVALAMIVILAGFFGSPFRHFCRNFGVMLGIFTQRQPSKTGEQLEAGDKGIFIVHNGRPFPFGFPYAAEDADKILTELERVSIPGQRLFVGPGDLRLTNYCDTYIYYLEPQLRPATYYLEMNPGSANAPQSRLASDIASADWVILNRRWDFLNEANLSTQFGPAEPIQVLRRDFDFWWQRGSYLLFRNKKISNTVVAPPPS